MALWLWQMRQHFWIELCGNIATNRLLFDRDRADRCIIRLTVALSVNDVKPLFVVHRYTDVVVISVGRYQPLLFQYFKHPVDLRVHKHASF